MAIVYLGIGSNIDNREANCLSSLEHLKKRGIVIRKCSAIYETEPWGIKDQPRFINMAVETETDMSAEKLLDLLKDVEHSMGRKETMRWGPRVIDLDILFYDDAIVTSERLHLPHPMLHERDFVLIPLVEIAPDKMHPTRHKTIRELWEDLTHDKDAQHKKQG
ncbi:MAG: 2-amino-4-hydroxy-6-hydroxymethyldihydropteridine diphosphokinase [Dissulfurispiraceae bacterium]